MEVPDKIEPGNKNKHTGVNSIGQSSPEKQQEKAKIAGRENRAKDKDTRNENVLDHESQGGVSDSLKGGDR